MGRSALVRLAAWLAALLLAVWALGAGVVVFEVGTQASDIDGPVSTRSRVFAGMAGGVLFVIGLALFVWSIVKIAALVRSSRTAD